MKNFTLLWIIVAVFSSVHAFSQSALKHKKQQTVFYYTQLNLHGGYISSSAGSVWDLSNRGPQNQIAFQVFARRQRNLQKGYTKRISLSQSKFRISIPFTRQLLADGDKTGSLGLKLLDAWLKFNTKWDRTNIWIGKKSIPYGHNPKLDPVSSFITNPTKSSIGFVNDFGIFVKTPISNLFDIEAAITLGGFLSGPVLTYGNLLKSENKPNERARIQFNDFKYRNTWLISAHIVSPTYKKNEIGLIMVAGRIPNTLDQSDLTTIIKIGGDWIYKYKEKFKWTNQAVLGSVRSDANGPYFSLHCHSNLDYFMFNNFFISSSFTSNNYNSLISDQLINNYTTASSLTYSFSTHTRLRLNHFYTHSNDDLLDDQWGLTVQFVTGFGKRP